VPLTVVTPVQVDPDRVPKFPLFWSGSFLDADNKLVKFPAVSKPGGGK
jgi:hypothetical protein